MRRAESRRAKSLGDDGQSIRIPRCSRIGDFEPVQCSNDIGSTECWCVDEYGAEIVGTRKDNEEDVNRRIKLKFNQPKMLNSTIQVFGIVMSNVLSSWICTRSQQWLSYL
jgi:Thyroglobulin type-1 repeat